MFNKLLIEKTRTATKFAVIKSGELKHLKVIKHGVPMLDDIYLGKIEKYNPTMRAAFVNVGEHTVFVPTSKLQEGTTALIQITRPPEKHKLARGTTDIAIGGEYIVMLASENGIIPSKKEKNNPFTIELIDKLKSENLPNYGILLRSKSTLKDYNDIMCEIHTFSEIFCQASSDALGLKYSPNTELAQTKKLINSYDVHQIITNDAHLSKALIKNKLLDKDNVSHDPVYLFNRNLIDFGKLLRPQFQYEHFCLTFNFLEALCVIDIDAHFLREKSIRPLQIRKTNERAFEEIFELLLLLQVGGLVVIDFITMDKEQNAQLNFFIQEYIRKNKINKKIAAHPITDGGLVQLVIEKKDSSVVSSISKPCSCCSGSGLELNEEMVLDSFEVDLISHISHTNQSCFTVYVPKSFEDVFKEQLASIAQVHNVTLYFEETYDSKITIQ